MPRSSRRILLFAGFLALVVGARLAAFAYNDRKFAPPTKSYVLSD